MNSTAKPLTTDEGEVPLDTVLDFGQAVRGKYAKRAAGVTRLVPIDEDVAAAFSSSAELNAALRGLLEASRHVHVKAL